MRTSRTAILSCAALLGLSSLISQAGPAFASPAGPTPPMVTGELDWKAPPTTTQPTIPEMDLVLPDTDDDPQPDPPLATPGDVDVAADPTPPQDDDDCVPGTAGPTCPPEDDCVPVPGGPDCCEEQEPVPGTAVIDPSGDDCPPPGGDCETHLECCEEGITLNPERPCPQDEPCEDEPGDGPQRRFEDCCEPEGGTDGPVVRHHDDCDDTDPCRPESTEPGHAVRTADEDCCIEQPEDDDRPSKRSEGGRDECPPDTGTDGSDGTTDGGGRLPKTGAEMATYGLAGLAFVGIGAALKRLGRKTA